MDAEQTLARASLFKEMDAPYLTRLAKVSRQRQFKAGDVILREGERGIAFFIIISGHVDVLRGAGPDQTVINSLGPDDTFGELALLNDLPRMATVQAVDDATCIALTRLDLLDAVRDQPEIALHMLKRLSELLRNAEERAARAPAS